MSYREEVVRLNRMIRYEREMWREAMHSLDDARVEADELRAKVKELEAVCKGLTARLIEEKRKA